MIVNQGKASNLLTAAPTGAGTQIVRFVLDADTILLSVYVRSTAGDVDVVLYSETQPGEDVVAVEFPTVSAATSDLLLRKAAAAMANLRLEVTYNDACEFEVWGKGLGVGETSARILGASTLKATQLDVGTGTTLLLAADLDDRAGILVRNWDGGGDLYVAESAAALTAGDGWPLAPREFVSIDLAAGVALYGKASVGTCDVRIFEAGG